MRLKLFGGCVLVAVLYVLSTPAAMVAYDECVETAEAGRMVMSLPPCNNQGNDSSHPSQYTNCAQARIDKATWPWVCTARKLVSMTPPASVARFVSDNQYLALGVLLVVAYMAITAFVSDRQNQRQVETIKQMCQVPMMRPWQPQQPQVMLLERDEYDDYRVDLMRQQLEYRY